jgi:hypothetical protein
METITKPIVLILSDTDHRNDPRVYRQIEALQHQCSLITAGTCPCTAQNTKHIELTKKSGNLVSKIKNATRLSLGFFESKYWKIDLIQQIFTQVNKLNFDIIIANDLVMLPVAVKLAKNNGAKIYFDAHEYFPLEYQGDLIFDLFFAKYTCYLCKTYLPQADVMTTVCNGIADMYQQEFHISCEVLTNASEFSNLSPTPIANGRYKIIHHGVAHRLRQLESTIHLVGKHLNDQFDLDLMLINNDDDYLKSLFQLTEKYPNVNFVTPVPMPEIASTINKYDIGIFMLPADCFNYKHALPNKLFEFIQGRLAIAIWPSPEMKKIVEQHQLGVIADDYTIESMAIKLKNLTVEDIVKFKANSHKVAALYNSERNAEQLKSIIARLS